MRILIILILFGSTCWAQSHKTYYSIEEAKRNPELVYHLDLSKQKLKQVPEDILLFSNLESLSLRKNKLKEIKLDLSSLTQIKTLNLSKNKLNNIPKWVYQLPKLEELNLSQNPINKIDPEINQLTLLLIFDCWDCELKELPLEMKELQKLIEVDIRQTYIRQQDAGEYFKWWPNTKVQTTWGCNCGH